LGLLCFDPQSMEELSPQILSLNGPAEWVEVPLDEDAFLFFLAEVMDVLELTTPPEANEECKFCAYRAAARNTEF
jgi:hypothetical protein